ncbi:MAG TPA: hypothetical protein VLX56_02725 [Nitrososphaerales archaeon]|nr:hypothetical protein [Nitrososphaerales archaeon]
MRRLVLVAAVLAVLETAWALYAGAYQVNFWLFYGVLLGASLVFFVPGVVEKRAPPAGGQKQPDGRA